MTIDLESALPAEAEDSARQRILDAARDLYIEQGLRGTTMEDVARRAGMGRATVYRRFSEKGYLFQALVMREAQRDLVEVEKAIRHFTSYLDGLLEAFVMAVTLIHRNPLLSHLLTNERDHVVPFMTTHFGDILNFSRLYLAGQIALGQKAGHIRQIPADVVAEMFLRLSQSLTLSPEGVINARNESSLRRFVDQLLRPLLTP